MYELYKLMKKQCNSRDAMDFGFLIMSLAGVSIVLYIVTSMNSFVFLFNSLDLESKVRSGILMAFLNVDI